MDTRVLVAPSVLAADFARLADEVATVEADADWLHLDIMDGRFVDNFTFGPPVVAAVRRVTKLPLECHLMVERPEGMLAPLAEAGATRVIVHVEVCPQLHRTLARIRDLGMAAGVALNPGTPFLLVEPVLHLVDTVLFMTVDPGAGGQRLLPHVLTHLSRARDAWAEVGAGRVVLEVDGGITAETAAQAVAAGARALVAGTAVFGERDRGRAIRRLREAGKGAVP